jgi:hypothetical protein
MNSDASALRAYASKVTALHGRALALWRRPPLTPKPAPPTPEPGEQCWEGEGGRVRTPAAAK